MKSISVREAKYNFDKLILIDTARAEPVVIEKHGRPVVVAVEEFERLSVKKVPKRQPDKSEKKN